MARNEGLYIVVVQSHYREKQFAKTGPMSRLCIPESLGWELFGVDINWQSNRGIVVPKHTYSPFEPPSGLKEDLVKHHVNSVLIAGFTTDNCAVTTAYGALLEGFGSTLLANCVSTAGYKHDVHQQTLREVAQHHYLQVADSRQINFF